MLGSTTHANLTHHTHACIVIIVYKIQWQMQLVSENTGGQQKVQPLEKRLMFFSILYFLLNLVIIISFMTKSLRDNFVEEGTNNFLAFVTLQSTFQATNSVTTIGTNKTLSLLSPADQLRVESADKPLAVYVHGIGIRMEFILVLSVLNVSCQVSCCKRKLFVPSSTKLSRSDLVMKEMIITRLSRKYRMEKNMSLFSRGWTFC